jgi:hypothetical protein
MAFGVFLMKSYLLLLGNMSYINISGTKWQLLFEAYYFIQRSAKMKKGLLVGSLGFLSCLVFAQSSGGHLTGSIVSTLVTLIIIAAYFLLCSIPAKIAKSKGRSFVGWYIFSILVFIIALICSLCIRNKTDVNGVALPKVDK